MKKWIVIRHVRYWWYRIEFALWWARVGQFMGACPNAVDLQYLQDIWEGKA